MKKHLLIILLTFGLVGCAIVGDAIESNDLRKATVMASKGEYVNSFSSELSYEEAISCMVTVMSTYTFLPNPDLSVVRDSPNPDAVIIGNWFEIMQDNNSVKIHSFVNQGKYAQSCLSHSTFNDLKEKVS